MRKRFVKLFPALQHLNIPNAITTFGLILGIFACYFLTQQNLKVAIIFLFLASLMDGVDGFVAAKLNQQTVFGQYVDTLVDFFTCGIIPIWLVFDVLVRDPFFGGAFFENTLIVCALIFYCTCALWRLAYYNIIEADKFFTGLPVPGSMMMVTMSVWFVATFSLSVLLSAAMFFVIGVLMISGITLKKYGLWQKIMSIMGIIFFVMVIIF
ncbi:MAG: CDP-alcohol phosphatidyltransferase family protein [Defluviitaleaceae bacterium]|nr:CDP-alcohol phosphatidyltransferase family protein [Defluviitaleaceae bacterium]